MEFVFIFKALYLTPSALKQLLSFLTHTDLKYSASVFPLCAILHYNFGLQVERSYRPANISLIFGETAS